MKSNFLKGFLLLSSILASSVFANTIPSDFKSEKIPAKQLAKWDFYGKGKVSVIRKQVALQEADNSKGVMLISPKKYGKKVFMKYKVMALTPATVIVSLLSVSNKDSKDLSIPKNYDGNIKLWAKNKQSYFIAYKNAPHNFKPFIRKNPNAKKLLAQAKENVMTAGVYYDVEVGRNENHIWLSINGEKIVETNDPKALEDGHLAIRLRGVAGLKAASLIKDFQIFTKQ